jgi:hypothetical protein
LKILKPLPYIFRVIQISLLQTLVADKYNLLHNYPNPFNPVTVIKYSIPERTFVKLTVYDMLGREVKILVNGVQSRGIYTATWDASQVPTGVYLYKLQTDKYISVKKMVLSK